MNSFSQQEIKFNLMAVIKNRKELYEERIVELRQEKTIIETELESMGDMDTDAKATLSIKLQDIKDRIDATQGLIAGEIVKHNNWKAENIRRRHNYIPFLFNLLKVLAERDLLLPLIDRAKEKQKL